MERNVMWSRWHEPGLEHLRLVQTSNGIEATGILIAEADNVPFYAHYTILCDTQWRVQQVDISLLDGDKAILLKADGEGHWITASGNSMPSLTGCIDVDISATPFTNTLPIRRLDLAVGASRELTVAYIHLPEMLVKADKQRYTCLELTTSGGKYRYEGLLSNFTAELYVDHDGLVLDYPGLFGRVWTDGVPSTPREARHSRL